MCVEWVFVCAQVSEIERGIEQQHRESVLSSLSCPQCLFLHVSSCVISAA